MFTSSLIVVVVSVLLVINFQVSSTLQHDISKRSPQNFNIQSIRQKQISPDITVVDVVVDEPTRGRYPTQNVQYPTPNVRYPTQNVRYPVMYPNYPTNYYPNRGGQYPNIPNRRQQPEIHVIEVVEPNPNGMNQQQWQRYPTQQNQNQFVNPGNMYPNNPFFNQNTQNQKKPNRKRPYRPHPDFYIEIEEVETTTRRGTRIPLPPKSTTTKPEESSEEEKYIFDGGERTGITGYTKDNFPIIPLNKNDIRK